MNNVQKARLTSLIMNSFGFSHFVEAAKLTIVLNESVAISCVEFFSGKNRRTPICPR